MTIRLDHLLMGILGIGVAAIALFLGAQRLLHHHHPGMAIPPEAAQGIEAGFIQKASAQGEIAQCSPSTYAITCSLAGKDSVVHKGLITRLNFCTYTFAFDGDGSGTYNACAHKGKVMTPSSRDSLIAAESNVRATIPDIEAYYSDHNTYRGATVSELRTDYDSGLPRTGVTVVANSQRYCIESTVRGQTASVHGPGDTVVAAPCS